MCVCVHMKATAAGHTCTHSRATHLLRSRFDVSVYWHRTRSLSLIASQRVCCCTSSREQHNSHITHAHAHPHISSLETPTGLATTDSIPTQTPTCSFVTHASYNFLLHIHFPPNNHTLFDSVSRTTFISSHSTPLVFLLLLAHRSALF